MKRNEITWTFNGNLLIQACRYKAEQLKDEAQIAYDVQKHYEKELPDFPQWSDVNRIHAQSQRINRFVEKRREYEKWEKAFSIHPDNLYDLDVDDLEFYGINGLTPQELVELSKGKRRYVDGV